MTNLLFLIADKNSPMQLSEGALYAIVAILMVFAILLIFIGITTLIFKLLGLFEMKAEIEAAKKSQTISNNIVSTPSNNSVKSVSITDDDMMAAVLVATIDYRNEIKKDVRVVNIKEVK